MNRAARQHLIALVEHPPFPMWWTFRRGCPSCLGSGGGCFCCSTCEGRGSVDAFRVRRGRAAR